MVQEKYNYIYNHNQPQWYIITCTQDVYTQTLCSVAPNERCWDHLLPLTTVKYQGLASLNISLKMPKPHEGRAKADCDRCEEVAKC